MPDNDMCIFLIIDNTTIGDGPEQEYKVYYGSKLKDRVG